MRQCGQATAVPSEIRMRSLNAILRGFRQIAAGIVGSTEVAKKRGISAGLLLNQQKISEIVSRLSVVFRGNL